MTSSKIAARLKFKNTAEFLEKCLAAGYVARDGDKYTITQKGKDAGGEPKFSKKFGAYLIWPPNLTF